MKKIIFIIIILSFFTSCGNNESSNSDISINMKAPNFVLDSEKTYTVLAKAYDSSGNELSSASGTVNKYLDSSVTLKVIPQNKVSISVTIKDGDTTLIRASNISDIKEGSNSISLTLGYHTINTYSDKSDTGRPTVEDMKSFNNYSLLKFSEYSSSEDTNMYTSSWKDYLSVFNENKGIFEKQILVCQGTSTYNMETQQSSQTGNSVSLSDYAMDENGNFIGIEAPYDTPNLLRMYLCKSSENQINLVGETNVNFSQYDSKKKFIVNGKNEIKFVLMDNDKIQIFDVSLTTSGISFILNNTILAESFSDITSFTSVNLVQGTDERIYIFYKGSLKFMYSDDYGKTFSNSNILINGTFSEYNYDKNIVVNDSNIICGGFHLSSSSTSPLYSYKMSLNDTNSVDTNLILDQSTLSVSLHAYSYQLSDMLGSPFGKNMYYILTGETDLIYCLFSSDYGISWSKPEKLFDGHFLNNSYDYKKCVNSKNLKIYFKQPSSGSYDYNEYLTERYSILPETTTVSSSNNSPIIEHTRVTTSISNEPITITANITDDVSVSSAILYYKITGESTYESFSMTNSDSSYSATIPYNFVTPSGVSYYIQAWDNENLSSTNGTSSNPNNISVSY